MAAVDRDEMLLKNIQTMNRLEGFDVVIVCCSSVKQADYWQQRLDQGKGAIMPKSALVLSVDEDWNGGAGNALGTLYAFQKAQALAQSKYNLNLLEDLKSGKISVGLFHTAGKGTRLAPLPGAENNNKPGVKLPTTIPIGEGQAPITILEAVIKQTGCYAKSRTGRLSVFWGDQVFIPTAPVDYTVTHHVDILCSLGPMMTEQEWKAKGMDKYGLIAQCENGKGAQVEKVDHATALQLLSSLGDIHSVGVSLGSFSVSWQILLTLLKEFESELQSKSGKLDSDPHLWMPMTLDRTAYLHLMKQKGIDEGKSAAHYERIQKMLQHFHEANPDTTLGLFGPVDVGQGVYWWDYGQLKLYQKNTLLMTEKSKEAEMIRLFLGLPDGSLVRDSEITNTTVDEHSCVSASVIGSAEGPSGFVKNSVLSNVRCKYIEAEHCVLINVTAEKIVMKPYSIAYNLVDDKQSPTIIQEGILLLEEKNVLVGVFDENGKQLVIRSHMDTDGGKAWEIKVHGNDMTFEEVNIGNADACPTTLEGIISAAHDNAWGTLQ